MRYCKKSLQGGEMIQLVQLSDELQAMSDPAKAKVSRSFFKTGPGEYAEGEQFLGIAMSQLRDVAKSYQNLPLTKVKTLLQSKWHEGKIVAVLILLAKYSCSDHLKKKQSIVNFYSKYRRKINNWDLVDMSAPHIIGHFHYISKQPLPHQWLQEANLWSRRIVIVATHYFIKRHDFTNILSYASQLLEEPEDLIHKATGWMLREVGKCDENTLTCFLDEYATRMPRTMLRYAIEKLTRKQRMYYMRKI